MAEPSGPPLTPVPGVAPGAASPTPVSPARGTQGQWSDATVICYITVPMNTTPADTEYNVSDSSLSGDSTVDLQTPDLLSDLRGWLLLRGMPWWKPGKVG